MRNDLKFGLRLFLSANVPYVYRITGPNAWPTAKEAIIGVPERVTFPLKNRRPVSITKTKRLGILDNWFQFVTMKCITMYFFVTISIGFWLFCCKQLDAIAATFSYFLFISAFLLILSFVRIFFADTIWL